MVIHGIDYKEFDVVMVTIDLFVALTLFEVTKSPQNHSWLTTKKFSCIEIMSIMEYT